ncbi:MAG: bifunctional DNA-formamidopyrimidine glycosylase/DNA-(apurinic or apyrimidinic site) lyase [Proteobacteria bacterium]|nr:bifunctional DNA-formamidopyrimidine glycosylase/DNA-(apurinic or apyrimidinic site) lyase [Pseudomonadota bacterium]
MPELPEVETVCRGLRPVLEGREIARVLLRRADLRAPFPAGLARRLEGRRVQRIARRGKYMLWHLDDGGALIVHLGMSGRLLVGSPDSPPARHEHLRLITAAGAAVSYSDPRRFGLMAWARAAALDTHPLLARLGLEPFDGGFDAETLSRALRGRRAPIKALLLDQRVVAGLGNIYASESLFRAGISPRRGAGSVAGARAARLVAAIKAVLGEAIAAGGSSLRDHVRPSGELGYFQHRFAVYDREGQPCPGCDCDPTRTGGIRRLVQGGRATFFCSRRQR